MREIWKDIDGYDGLYKVSDCGNVFSCYVNRILKPGTTQDGYKYVSLHKDKKQQIYLVHRLVASSFLDNLDNLPCVNHKDENPSNNHVNNLEWCTYSYNNTYNNLHIRKAKLLAKHVYRYNEYGELFEEYESVQEAARILGASSGDIAECCNEKLLTYLNSVWSYIPLTKEDVLIRFEKSMRLSSRKNHEVISKVVYQYDLQMNFIASYPSTREAGRQLGISPSLIAGVCRGEHAYTHDFIFRYEEDVLNET